MSLQAPKGRYPYAVYLMDGNSPFCGGSLIAIDVILTAGHCITMTEGIQPYSIVIGRHNVSKLHANPVAHLLHHLLTF